MAVVMLAGVRARVAGRLAAPTSRMLSSFADSTARVIKPEYEQLYEASPQAFHNFPVNDIHFRVGHHFLHQNEAHPQLYFRDNEEPGLLHVTPPAPATYCWFGERGNLGKKKMFLPNQPEITEPFEAEQELSLKVTTPLMTAYVEWLQSIQEKFVEHLIANAGSYKKLKKLEGKNPAIIRDMAPPFVRFAKDEHENKLPGTEYISWRQRIYNKSDREAKVRCDLDQKMAAEGGVRRHVPLYTLTGEEIPLDQVRLWHNDIISVQNNIMCGLWGIGSMVGFKLRRNLRSVTLFEQASRETSGQAPAATSNAPFAAHK